jgi:hypothetical protein
MALAAPAFAQGPNPNHALKHAARDAKEAADAAAAAARAAPQAAATQAATAEKVAADTRAGKLAPPKGRGDKFTPATVKPYVDTLAAIAADLKATSSAAEASAYGAKFKAQLAIVESSRHSVLSAYAGAISAGLKSPDRDAAEKLLSSAGGLAEAIEGDMPRVQKLNPALAADFKKFGDLHDQE